MQVDYKKLNTFKVLLIVGIVLMIVSAFLNIVTVEDKSIEVGFSYFNMTTGGFLDPLEENLGSDEEMATLCVKILRALTFLIFWLPLIVMVVTAIETFLGKKLKFFSGLAVGNLVYGLVLDLGIYFGAIRGIKSYLEGTLGAWMSVDDLFRTSVLPILLFSAGLIICAVSAILSARNASSDGGEAGAGKLLLVCTEGHMTVDHVELPLDKPITVGRNAAMSAVVFDDSKVSKQHATLEYDKADKKMYITDVSTYGTSLADGTKLVKGAKIPVGSDTEIVLSQKSRFVIRY